MHLSFNNLELTGKNIIIVEDDLPSIRYYETVLKSSGAAVTIFHTGKDFIEYVQGCQIQIDMVLMDFLIPLVNGIECIKVFRQERKNTPVVMITAYSSEQTKTEAYIAGCNEYILKPIYPEKIFFIIDKYINKTRVPYPYLN
jgi:CheY-like chemotaxis protein